MPYTYRPFGGFRLVLAGLVMLQHFAADLAPEPLASRMLPFELGGVAVLAFFALSGFVIAEAADRIYHDRPLAFAGNRLLRIVPHFVLAVALSILLHKLSVATGGSRLWRSEPDFPHAIAFEPVNVALNFVGIVPFVDRWIGYNFLDIAWAVRIEIAFYAAIFLVVALAGPARTRRPLATSLACAWVPFLGLFVLAMLGRGPGMFQFVPYFAFGAAAYFTDTGVQWAKWIAAAALPLMVWQYLRRAFSTPIIASSVLAPWINLLLLFTLIGILVLLATARRARWRRTDRLLGNLTYPLYLYHEDVLVLLLTFTVGYSWGVFVAGLLLSLAVAGAFYALVDPAVGRYRDWLRGQSLESTAAAAESHLAEVPQ